MNTIHETIELFGTASRKHASKVGNWRHHFHSNQRYSYLTRCNLYGFNIVVLWRKCLEEIRKRKVWRKYWREMFFQKKKRRCHCFITLIRIYSKSSLLKKIERTQTTILKRASRWLKPVVKKYVFNYTPVNVIQSASGFLLTCWMLTVVVIFCSLLSLSRHLLRTSFTPQWM